MNLEDYEAYQREKYGWRWLLWVFITRVQNLPTYLWYRFYMWLWGWPIERHVKYLMLDDGGIGVWFR